MFHLISRYNTIAKTMVYPAFGSNTFFWNCKGSTEFQPGFSHSVSLGRMNFHHALKQPDNAILSDRSDPVLVLLVNEPRI